MLSTMPGPASKETLRTTMALAIVKPTSRLRHRLRDQFPGSSVMSGSNQLLTNCVLPDFIACAHNNGEPERRNPVSTDGAAAASKGATKSKGQRHDKGWRYRFCLGCTKVSSLISLLQVGQRARTGRIYSTS